MPDLRIVPVSNLHPHEHADEQRAKPLEEALRRDGVLKNPPIVLPVEGGKGASVVLDGANRVRALRRLKIPHVLVQVVHPNSDSVQVETWNHVLLRAEPSQLLQRFQSLNEFHLSASGMAEAEAALEAGESLVNVMLSPEEVYETKTQDDSLKARIEMLNEFVSAYTGEVAFERTSASKVEGLREVYSDLGCLVVFPVFEADEVVEGAARGWRFPPGITRFIVSPRALRVNYPLDRLEGDVELEKKQAELEEWIRERKRDRRVRFYEESTFLFDE